MSLPTSVNGYSYVLVIVDLFTSYCITRPLKTKGADEVAQNLLQIIGDWGPPKIFMSDQGKEFDNEIVNKLTKLTGTEMRFATPYHHQSIGKVERLNQTIANSLRKMLNGSLQHWDTILPLVTHYYNVTVRSLTRTSPFALMFTRTYNQLKNGSSWVTDANADVDTWLSSHKKRVLDEIYPAIREIQQGKRAKQAAAADKQHRLVQPLAVGTYVMVRDQVQSSKHDQPYVGPYRITSITRTGSYEMTDDVGTTIRRPISHLKVIPQPSDADKARKDTYIIDHIVKHRGTPGAYQYLVSWKGYSTDEDTWEDASNFNDHEIIDRYWKQLAPTRQRTNRSARGSKRRKKRG